MGFYSFLRKIFSGEDKEEAELDAARARHGITVDKVLAANKTTEEERFAENYDVWEDIKSIRGNFFFGSWVNRKFHVVGEDKVKKQLEDLEKKREEERKKKGE